MVRSMLATVTSLVLTTTVITHAYYLKRQFYPTVVYLTKSSPSMAVLYIQAFVLVFLVGKFMRKVFFGQLRAAEMEHLIERSWYAVTETCLAFTVFRDDFSPRFVAIFTLLLFLKCFHWLAEDRVDFMERSPNISVLFHFRVTSLMGLLTVLDLLFVNHACHSIITRGASVQLVFGFEYAILLTMVLTIFIKYVLHSIDLQSENPWDNKAVYMLYTELLTGFIKVLLYMAFMTIMIKVHTFPLFAIRPMYLTMRCYSDPSTSGQSSLMRRHSPAILSGSSVVSGSPIAPAWGTHFVENLGSIHRKRNFPFRRAGPRPLVPRQFKKAVTDAIMSRRAIRNMNTLYPDASPEELQLTDNVCIICREEMVTGAKRLPCNHIFHTSCLRSWFQRQQTCPTCRMDVLRTTLPTQTPVPPPAQPQAPIVPQQPNLPPGMMPPFPPGLFPFWPPMANLGQNFFPQAPGAAPNTPQPGPSAPSGSDAQSNAANGDASRASESAAGTGLEQPPAGSIPGFPFSFPPFPSAPWMGMPPPPFAMPPMPMPPSGFAGLTEEELRAMEGQERQNLEARLQCLQNIHTLLDAAMVQIHQYLSVVATLSPPRPPAAATAESTVPSTETAELAVGSQTSSPGEPGPSPALVADNSSVQPAPTPEEIGQSDLEGAMGYTPPLSDDLLEDGEETLGEPDTAELRRRRLRKLEQPSAQH